MSRLSRCLAGLVAVAAALLVLSCSTKPSRGPDAQLSFLREGKLVRAVPREALTQRIPVETVRQYDPYYNKQKTFRALPIRALLEMGFDGDGGTPFETQQWVLRARDGYTVPIAGSRLLEGGAYVAIEDAEVPGWETIGPQRANPAPFYLIWKGDAQQSLETHPRPWQLASFDMARFESVFPHTVPTGEAEGSAPMRGFAVFRDGCVRCHAVNREGGRTGPDLNVPKSIVEYRPEAQIRAYVRDPASFRYGNMPPHPHLSDGDLDALIAYFHAMKTRKWEPAKAP